MGEPLSLVGNGSFPQPSISVPARWRIRYRLAAAASLPPLAQFSWLPDGDPFAGHGFVATDAGSRTTSCQTAPARTRWP